MYTYVDFPARMALILISVRQVVTVVSVGTESTRCEIHDVLVKLGASRNGKRGHISIGFQVASHAVDLQVLLDDLSAFGVEECTPGIVQSSIELEQ
jgi:hypothetical protein